MNGLGGVGCLNTLQIKAVAMPRRAEGRQGAGYCSSSSSSRIIKQLIYHKNEAARPETEDGRGGEEDARVM